MNDRVHLINALVQYPQRRTWALEHLAGIARRDLHDVPPFSESRTWQSFASAHDDPAQLNPPDWKLNIAEGADGVAGLQHEVSQSSDTRAARWSAAASLLRLCLDALEDPDNITAEQIRRIDNATMQPYAVAAENNRIAQSKRASNPRSPHEVSDIIARLAHRDETLKALWAAFEGDLDAAGLHPVAGTHGRNLAVWYESDTGRRRMTIGTFGNRIRRARN